jgi:collagen type III alpha
LSVLPIGDASHHNLGSGDGFTIGIVGESYRQGALHDLAGSPLQRGEHVTFIAALIPKPENPYDPNAIRVDIQGGAQVGYLSRDDAVRYRATFATLTARHLIGVARAKLIGGVVGKPSIGVMLDINQPTDLLESLAPEDQPF